MFSSIPARLSLDLHPNMVSTPQCYYFSRSLRKYIENWNVKIAFVTLQNSCRSSVWDSPRISLLDFQQFLPGFCQKFFLWFLQEFFRDSLISSFWDFSNFPKGFFSWILKQFFQGFLWKFLAAIIWEFISGFLT